MVSQACSDGGRFGRQAGWDLVANGLRGWVGNQEEFSLPVCTLALTVVLFAAWITGEEAVEERCDAHSVHAWFQSGTARTAAQEEALGV